MKRPSFVLPALVAITCALSCTDETVNPLGTTSGTTDASSSSTGGASSSSSTGAGGQTSGPELLAGASCDPMVPSHCGFPFPSNVYLVNDTSTESGKRVAFGAETLPVHPKVGHIPPSIVADSDGFSPGQAPMTDMPGATATGLPTQHTLDESIATTSPTILLDAETGHLVPHFAEIDMNGEEGDRVLMIRPVVRLPDAHRFIVAVRKVVDSAQKEIAPSPVFQALRDKTPSDEPSVELRRTLYEDIFAKLSLAGIPRDNLQIAWDYTTASRANNTSRLVAMRDAALASLGPNGPAYVVDTVTDDPNPEIARRIEGHFTVPLFLDGPNPGAHLVLDAAGHPTMSGTAEYPFIVQIPHAATSGTPGAILQNGHGLLGSRNEGRNGYLAKIANRGNFVTVAVDLIGMAEEDETTVVSAILNDPSIFRPFVDRQLQGMINELVAMRMMMGAFAEDPVTMPTGTPTINTARRYYRGDSQGGIFGATYMAVSTDVTRGLLGEPGAPYNLLLNRSVDFGDFFAILATKYPSKRDIQLVLGIVQMLWDRIEPNGFIPFVRGGELGVPHEVLIHAAVGDHQVTPLGAELMARAFGAKSLAPAVRPIWGVLEESGMIQGAAIVEYDYKDLVPPAPDTNTPTTAPDSTDPHDWVREELSAIDQSAQFFFTGQVTPFCAGACDPN
ncbi:MAG: hypothetical protein U0414_18080 [Polyangiaceae bacterium]